MFATPLYDADFEKLYEPSEDTYVVLDTLEEIRQDLVNWYFPVNTRSTTHSPNKVPICVEIGTGTGIITTFIQKNILGPDRAIYLTTDVNDYACATSIKTNGLNKKKPTDFGMLDTIKCDLVGPLARKCVDLLVFNPPYVPSEEVPDIVKLTQDKKDDDDKINDLLVDLALCGGADGMETTWRLLDNLDSILSDTGMALILFCARNKPEQVVEQFKQKMRLKGVEWKVERVFIRKAGWEELTVWKFVKDW
ncbi:S-adenosylmethionine-dependent methyltransferase [Saccharomycopsis crataegensis]|uniref:S-adenosylmethionine-dependent methyltransferase n=1 Tax=Saccharomycopsis crataegensis TaxID=43959 RepID=A0AAV5QEM3_9ASCO|nr:S-adenosylmethionine-dependent methyltransferase [Saccharomycopsis crataegensis]